MKILSVLVATVSLAFASMVAHAEEPVRQGVVIAVYKTQAATRGVGMTIGAITGGLLGHRVGEGIGKTLASVTGAIAGGTIGNHVETAMGRGAELIIRLAGGYQTAIRLRNGGQFHPGQRVYIVGYSNDVQVYPM